MDPRLAAVAGPLNGVVCSLGEVVDFSIGRDPASHLCINDSQVSRQHCLIRQEAEQVRILDLDSRNGTFINGVPVKERVLRHGDQIRIAGTLLVFLFDEEAPAAPARAVELDETEWVPRTTMALQLRDAVYLNPASPPEALPATARIGRDLKALLKIGTLVNSSPDLETLAGGLLDSILQVVPAGRGAILLLGASPDSFTSVMGRQYAESEGPIRVSHTIVRQVLREGAAVLANDLLDKRAFKQAKSLQTARIASVLCVPLTVFEKCLGAIYLDTQDPKAKFGEQDLQLLTAVAGIAALALTNLMRLERLEDDNRRLRADIDLQHDMVGESPRLREVHQFIAKVAPTSSTVLICGESGTGKELAARAIHRNGPRADKPFAAINCAALTETLLESELFGHEKGAFTGAIAQKKGKLEAADGGTVFLDEVGELLPALQAKLLRVLQHQEFERVGGTLTVKVDIRLVAATNKDLEEAIRSGVFRRDLYYRLNVVSLTMPPLRERREDIPLMASYFVAKYSARAKRKVIGLSSEARDCLLAYDWPGNVRELENAIERSVVLGTTDLVLPEDLPDALLEVQPPPGLTHGGYYEAVNEAKRQLILKALEEAGGNYAKAANLLGMHVNYLHRLIRNLNLKAMVKRGR